MKIVLTHHAQKKFKDLLKIGVIVSKRAVLLTIKNPEHIDRESDKPKLIASKPIDSKHILRVVFKVEDDIITIITFYPAKRGRYYEDKKN